MIRRFHLHNPTNKLEGKKPTTTETMKPTRLLLTSIAATLACSMTTYAQGDGQGQGGKKGKGKHNYPEHVIKKFDKDGDGKLNKEERKAAEDARKKIHKANKEKMLKRFDKDGDGKLSDEERQTARDTMKKERKEMHTAKLKKFDSNGNGKIDKDERDGVPEWIKENYPDALLGKPHHKGDKKGKKGKKGKRGKKGNKANNDTAPAEE